MAELIPDPETTKDVYDRQAAQYDAQRSHSLFEARWLARFCAALPPEGHVLDLGCGTGMPIAHWFRTEGFRVTGVDFSPGMLEIARTRWPDGDWRLQDMRALDQPERFDGIIAWNSFYHLTPEDQIACIGRVATHLRPGGSFLTTVGPRAGAEGGAAGDERVYHASLSPAGYASALEDHGLRLTGFLAEDPETQNHSVLTARKED